MLGIEAAAFRKRLSRARGRMRAFMERSCGLVSETAACRCSKQIGPSVAMGLIDPAHLVYAAHAVAARTDPQARQQYEAIEAVHRTTAVHRSHPRYAAPEELVHRLRAMIEASPA